LVILLLIKVLKTELYRSIMRILVTLPDLTIGPAGQRSSEKSSQKCKVIFEPFLSQVFHFTNVTCGQTILSIGKRYNCAVIIRKVVIVCGYCRMER